MDPEGDALDGVGGGAEREVTAEATGAAGPPLLLEHTAELFRYVRFLVGSSAPVEDIVQETMVRAIASFHRYDPARPLRAWLRGIALKVAHKHWRRVRRARTTEQPLEPAAVPSTDARNPEEDLVLQERADLLYRALDTLPAHLREALMLHVGERLPAEEVARLTGTSVTNVYTRVCRARALVRSYVTAAHGARDGAEDTP
jgi:RNA polymerase sigma-70 factor (ECF subfamily)